MRQQDKRNSYFRNPKNKQTAVDISNTTDWIVKSHLMNSPERLLKHSSLFLVTSPVCWPRLVPDNMEPSHLKKVSCLKRESHLSITSLCFSKATSPIPFLNLPALFWNWALPPAAIKHGPLHHRPQSHLLQPPGPSLSFSLPRQY